MASAWAKLIPMLFAAAFGAAVPTATPGQSSELHGRVVSVDGAPIAGATITLVGARAEWFVTPEEPELREPQNVTDAARHFPNILLSPIDDGKIDPGDGMYHADGMPLVRKFRIEDSDGCPLTWRWEEPVALCSSGPSGLETRTET